ncbi:hypothetical protein ACFWIW_10255 [Amycolatopsis sp. NPDC058340]|uniref:hypothetical protein n=1 Tax=Amycolatopsis sp. NPDC058340 TaxID=3346453 RepID=UPI0036481715
MPMSGCSATAVVVLASGAVRFVAAVPEPLDWRRVLVGDDIVMRCSAHDRPR